MRYEPLISATGASGGSGNGKSGFDRGGYTGYNIRGAVHIGVDIIAADAEGVEPGATDVAAAGGVGLGDTSTETANSAIGGNVSFRPKSADDYLRPGKTSAFGYRSGYDSADRSWQASTVPLLFSVS
jgi:hemoglobin/transferrin/lactoferrin receptor protein